MGNLDRINIHTDALRTSEPLPDIYADRITGEHRICKCKTVNGVLDSLEQHIYQPITRLNEEHSVHEVEMVNFKASLNSIYDANRAEKELQLTNMVSD